MTHQQKRAFKFYVPYFWNGVLCMCDLCILINKNNKIFHFQNVGF